MCLRERAQHKKEIAFTGTYVVAKWLGLCTFIAGGAGSIPGWGTKISQAVRPKKKKAYRAYLVAQWVGVRLPVQGTRVRALVWEDPTCRGATSPVRHNY